MLKKTIFKIVFFNIIMDIDIVSNKNEIIIIVIAISLFALCSNVKHLNKNNRKIMNNALIKMLILMCIAYCAYNRYIEIALAGFALYIMLQYHLLNDDIGEAMLNTHEIKNIERFTNIVN